MYILVLHGSQKPVVMDAASSVSKALNEYFPGYILREKQKECFDLLVSDITLNKCDLIVSLPTNAGKSLIFSILSRVIELR